MSILIISYSLFLNESRELNVIQRQEEQMRNHGNPRYHSNEYIARRFLNKVEADSKRQYLFVQNLTNDTPRSKTEQDGHYLTHHSASRTFAKSDIPDLNLTNDILHSKPEQNGLPVERLTASSVVKKSYVLDLYLTNNTSRSKVKQTVRSIESHTASGTVEKSDVLHLYSTNDTSRNKTKQNGRSLERLSAAGTFQMNEDQDLYIHKNRSKSVKEKTKTQKGIHVPKRPDNCVNIGTVAALKEFEKILQWIRSDSTGSSHAIMEKTCTPCGVDFDIRVLATTSNSTNSSHHKSYCATMSLIDGNRTNCWQVYKRQLHMSHLQNVLRLQFAPPSLAFHLNGTSSHERHLLIDFKDCLKNASSVSDGYTFGLLKTYFSTSSIVQSQLPDPDKSEEIPKQHLEYLALLYIGNCIKQPRDRHWKKRPNSYVLLNSTMCFVDEKENNITNDGLSRKEGSQLILHRNYLCSLPSSLIDSLHKMAAIESLNSSVATSLAKLALRRLGKQFAKLLIGGMTLYEELDGRVANLLRRYQVKFN